MGSIMNAVPQVLNLAEAKQKKISEIRKIAERVGQEGVDINTGAHTFHMAATPDDVTPAGLHLTRRDDVYTHTTTTRRKIERDNDQHSGSGGSSFSGGGGHGRSGSF